mmetsp:Transcript_31190/g.76096  ORF Transcript_31190/g.76096 Transcript_31190/m.76096 type:complete len:100 (+) Transcript_31190:109-408(+)
MYTERIKVTKQRTRQDDVEYTAQACFTICKHEAHRFANEIGHAHFECKAFAIMVSKARCLLYNALKRRIKSQIQLQIPTISNSSTSLCSFDCAMTLYDS